jgi:hypothetical protein
MVGFHRPDQGESDYFKIRSRTYFWRLFKHKWNVKQYIKMGAGLWGMDGTDVVLNPSQVRQRFYGADRCPPRTRELVVISTKAARESKPANGAGREGPLGIGSVIDLTSAEDTKHEKQFLSELPVFDPAQWQVWARYDPIYAGGTNLLTWWAGIPKRQKDPAQPPVMELRARWFSADNVVLVWETPSISVELATPNDWRPTWFEMPLIPPTSSCVRFEIVAETRQGLMSLCFGFLRPALQGNRPRYGEVLALSGAIETHATDVSPVPGEPDNATVLRGHRVGPAGNGLLILDLEALANATELCIRSWPGAGTAHAAVVLTRGLSDFPRKLALPDVAPRTGTELLVRNRGNQIVSCPVIIEDATASHEAANRAMSGDDRVTVVLTSCGRQDLLERTIDSFYAFNTAPIAEFIVIEDGPGHVNAPLTSKYNDRSIRWLATEKRVGQIAAIDYAYAHVHSPYVFHLEDDWEFYRAGFIEKSMIILSVVPDCLQVWIRAVDDTNGHPLVPSSEVANGLRYRRLQFGFKDTWHGFSFNPGLRRMADYLLLGRYSWFTPSKGWAAEALLSAIYKELGFFAAILTDDDGRGYVKHLGWSRSVPDSTTVGQSTRVSGSPEARGEPR